LKGITEQKGTKKEALHMRHGRNFWKKTQMNWDKNKAMGLTQENSGSPQAFKKNKKRRRPGASGTHHVGDPKKGKKQGKGVPTKTRL